MGDMWPILVMRIYNYESDPNWTTPGTQDIEREVSITGVPVTMFIVNPHTRLWEHNVLDGPYRGVDARPAPLQEMYYESDPNWTTPGTQDIEREISITGEQIIMISIIPHAHLLDHTSSAGCYRWAICDPFYYEKL